MTTIYIPRLIESAEQAETLPAGTLAKDGDLTVAVKAEDGRWARTDVADGLPVMGSSSMVGWTALVPIEAEEEVEAASHVMGKLAASGVEVTERTGDVASWQRRYVTPWVEDALPDGWESFTVTGEEA